MPDQTLIAQINGAVAAGPVAEKIDLDFNGTLDMVSLSAGTAPTADLVLDVLLNGTSVFAQPVGVVAGTDSTGPNAATAGITATDTRIGVTVNGSATQAGIQRNSTILVEAEEITVPNAEVGSNSQQGAGSTDRTPGGVDSGSTSFTLVISPAGRGANGTTAAAHAHGVSVFSAKPRLTASGTGNTGVKTGLASPVKFNQGDVLSFSVTGGTGSSDLSIEVGLSRN